MFTDCLKNLKLELPTFPGSKKYTHGYIHSECFPEIIRIPMMNGKENFGKRCNPVQRDVTNVNSHFGGF